MKTIFSLDFYSRNINSLLLRNIEKKKINDVDTCIDFALKRVNLSIHVYVLLTFICFHIFINIIEKQYYKLFTNANNRVGKTGHS